MTASSFFNRVQFTATNTGTVDFHVDTAIAGYRTPAQAGISNNTVVSYVAYILSGNGQNAVITDWETGQGTYTSANITVSRTTIRESTNNNNKVNFASRPTVILDFQAQDITAVSGVGGSNTQIQFNQNGAFAGDASLVWNTTSSTLVTTGTLVGPIHAGGTGSTSTLTVEATTGAGTSDAIIFKTGSQSERMRIDTNGNILLGVSGGVSSVATNGFVNLEACAGTPTGTPTSVSGLVPTVYDTTNDKLWFYNSGWKGAPVTSSGGTLNVTGLEFVIDGGGAAITTGIKGDLEVPFNCTINRATLLGDQTGTLIVNVWKDTYANFPPTSTVKITSTTPPTISSATKAQDSTLSGWTTGITAGDILRFNVDSCVTITRGTLSLKVTKT